MRTVRSVVSPFGQRVTANDRLYLAEHVPFLIVWGDRDPIIPVQHGYDAHAAVPASRLELFEAPAISRSWTTPTASPNC